jgi:hypothetical protein
MGALRLICQAVDNSTVSRQHTLAGAVSGPKVFVSKWKIFHLICQAVDNSILFTPLAVLAAVSPSTLLKMEGFQHFAKLWMVAVSVH